MVRKVKMSGEEETHGEEPQGEESALWRYTKAVAGGVYGVLYNLGGFLANLFGITSTRYPEIVREYERLQEEERRREAGEEDGRGEDQVEVEA